MEAARSASSSQPCLCLLCRHGDKSENIFMRQDFYICAFSGFILALIPVNSFVMFYKGLEMLFVFIFLLRCMMLLTIIMMPGP